MLRTGIQDVKNGYILVLTAGILFIVIFGNNMAGWRHDDGLKNTLRKKYFMRTCYLNYANVLPKIASISMEHSSITQTNNSAASQIVDNLQLNFLTKRPPLFFINFNTNPPLSFLPPCRPTPGMSQVMAHPDQSCNVEELGDEWTIAGSRRKYFKRSLEKNQEKVYTYIVKAAIWLKILTKSCQIVDK